MADTRNTAGERAGRRVKGFTDFMWHLATFVIINGFLWFVDLLQGGVDWAYWITITWGIGLAFHLAYFLIGDTGTRNRRYTKYLEQEKARERADA
jgi:hypothetical protein